VLHRGCFQWLASAHQFLAVGLQCCNQLCGVDHGVGLNRACCATVPFAAVVLVMDDIVPIGLPEDTRTPAERAATDAAHERRYIIKSFQRQIIESELVTKSLKDALAKFMADNPDVDSDLAERVARGVKWMQRFVIEHPAGPTDTAMVMFNGFQSEVHALPALEMDAVVQTLRRVHTLSWPEVLADPALKCTAESGTDTLYSIDLAAGHRAIAAQDGKRMLLLALDSSATGPRRD
jgi:hypothetical protein